MHVRCLEVHGIIHMMVAKSTTWSYLKRGWDNDLAFERASRSLAKTGSNGPPRTVKSFSKMEGTLRFCDMQLPHVFIHFLAQYT